MAGKMVGWRDDVIYPAILQYHTYSQMRNGRMAECSNGYIPTTFMVHAAAAADDNTNTFKSYSIDHTQEYFAGVIEPHENIFLIPG
jgi:hypothetical protein